MSDDTKNLAPLKFVVITQMEGPVVMEATGQTNGGKNYFYRNWRIMKNNLAEILPLIWESRKRV